MRNHFHGSFLQKCFTGPMITRWCQKMHRQTGNYSTAVLSAHCQPSGPAPAHRIHNHDPRPLTTHVMLGTPTNASAPGNMILHVLCLGLCPEAHPILDTHPLRTAVQHMAHCSGSARTPLCNIPSGCCFFTGPWTVTRSSLRMLRWVAAFCRPLRPLLLLVSFPRSRSPVVGVPGLCWMWHGVPFARQWRPVVGVLRLCWLLRGSFDCFCCPRSVHRPSITCLAVFPCV